MLASGMKLTPARINPQAQTGKLAANYTLTAVPGDLSGTSLSFTVPNDGALYLATWSADFQLVTAGTLTCVVQLLVDGVALSSPQAIWNPANVTNIARETEGQSYSGSLAAGTHTFRLQGSAVITSGSARLNALHTQLTVVVFP